MAKKHCNFLDDPSKITIAGYKCEDLIRVAEMLKNSESWKCTGMDIAKAMEPVIQSLIDSDNERLSKIPVKTVSDAARKVTDHQTQRLRVMYTLVGWSLFQLAQESEMLQQLLENWRKEAFNGIGVSTGKI